MNRRNSRFSIVSSVDDTNSVKRSGSIIQPELTTVSHPSVETGATSITQSNLTPMIRSQIAENFLVIWLDFDQKYSDEDKSRSISQLQYVTQSVQSFTDSNQCIDFMTDVIDEEVFLIISGSRIQQLLSIIEDISQLRSIYIFDTQDHYDVSDFREHKKIKGLFTRIEHIGDALKRDISRLMMNLTPFSIISTTSTPKIDELDPSFMYTQLIKEITLEIEPDPNAIEQFVQYYLSKCSDKDVAEKSVNEFPKTYSDHLAIWWYAREEFLFATINKALRTQDTKTIIKMSFFLRDLHREIEQRYLAIQSTIKIIVYRGQKMPTVQFKNLTNNEGGLFSFNSFLSTSLNRDVSLMFADDAVQDSNTVNILFRIEVDPSISSTPYLALQDMGLSDSNEEEVLFSMQSIFRIGQVNQIGEGLWEVVLTSTSDKDLELKCLTNSIRQQVEVVNGWHRMGLLMQMMGKFEEALDIYASLLERTLNDDRDLPRMSENLSTDIAEIHYEMGNYSNALIRLEETLRKYQDKFPPDHLIFGSIYNSMAVLYQAMGNHSRALSKLEIALEIWQKSLPPNHPNLGLNYNNIAAVHQSMGNYPIALTHFEKALAVLEKSLPPNHPNLGLNYNNIAEVHQSMGNYPIALTHLEKALAIWQKSLPSDHPNLGITYHNIGEINRSMGNYPITLTHFEKALAILEKSLPSNHPKLGGIYNNIAGVYQLMGNYPIALTHLEKALAILEKSLPSNHPNMGLTYHNIGEVNRSMGNYPIALTHLEKALAIWQKSLPSDHPNLGLNYNNIGGVYDSMGNYPIALTYYEKALAICQKSLPSDHPDLGLHYNNIAAVHQSMGNYPIALTHLEKALAIWQKSLPSDHPNLGLNYNNIGGVYKSMGNYPIALTHLEKALAICQKSLPSDHPDLGLTYNNIAVVHQSTGNYPTALKHFEKALAIWQKSLPSDHPNLGLNYNNIGGVYDSMGNYPIALTYYEKALAILQISFPSNHRSLVLIRNCIASLCKSMDVM